MIEGIKEIGDIIISEAPEKFLQSLTLNVFKQTKSFRER